jgi:hypothetical protein
LIEKGNCSARTAMRRAHSMILPTAPMAHE